MRFLAAALVALSPALAAATAHPRSPCAAPNQLLGTWTLTSANTTINGTTSYPYGEHPQGLLFHTPAPDCTWIEELNARPGVPSGYPAQSNGGTYAVDARGDLAHRLTLASTVPGNVGLADNTSVLTLARDGDTLVQVLTPAPGVVGRAVWTRFRPGSTEI